jgi:hypothetical protein
MRHALCSWFVDTRRLPALHSPKSEEGTPETYKKKKAGFSASLPLSDL